MSFIKKYIKLFKINRFSLRRLGHLLYNIFPFSVRCSICNWRGRKFYNGYCPICFSQARHRLLGYIQALINIDCNANILLIGPGPTEIILFKLRFNYETKILNIQHTDFTDIVADITDDNIKLNNYDIIIMWHVLEHIVEDKKAVGNVYKMLKDGGVFLFSVPIHPVENNKTYIPAYSNLEDKISKTGHPDHFICCGYDYPNRFSNIGFTRFKTISVKHLSEEIISRFNLSTDHIAWTYIK